MYPLNIEGIGAPVVESDPGRKILNSFKRAMMHFMTGVPDSRRMVEHRSD